MNFLTIFCVIFCVISMIHADTTEEKKEKVDLLEEVSKPCIGQDGITKDDFDNIFRKEKEPETKPEKCLVTCIQTQVEIIKDGKFQKERFILLITQASGEDSSKAEIIEGIANECDAVSDDDPCEYGYKLTMCYKEAAEKRGIDFDKLQQQ